MNAQHPIGDPAELAALYALGELPPEQAAEFERHLAAGCELCAGELRRLDRAVTRLFSAAPEIPVAPHIRDELLRRIASACEPPADRPQPNPQVWKHWSPDDASSDLIIRDAMRLGWERTGIDGIEVRRLFVDQRRNQMTALVRMAAGTAYPPHRHGGPEECLVLEGTLRVGSRLLHAGDYQRMAQDSEHEVQSTDDGCTLLIISSLTDELT